MMYMYKVEIEKLTYDYGTRCGWKVVGYYISENKANKEAESAFLNRDRMIEGKTKITKLELNTDED